MSKSLIKALNAVLLDSKGELKSYIESANSEQVEEEVKTFKGIIHYVAHTTPGIMLETLEYLIKHPDSELFQIVMPALLNSYVLYHEKELPEGMEVLIEKALEYGYYDKCFVAGKFFDSLSVNGKVRALKMLSRYSTTQNQFLLGGKILNIEYEVYSKISPATLNRLINCLPLFELDDRSLKALTMYAFANNELQLKNYLSKILPHVKRCRNCYNGEFFCNGRVYYLADFNPPEVCPKGR